MLRREFLTLSGSALIATRAHAQRSRQVRIGYLSPGSPPDAMLQSFRAGMHDHGYVENGNYELLVRYAHRDYSRVPLLVQELLAAQVDLVVTAGATTRSAPFLAQSVPVVFGFSGDPVDAGFVASLARPGGNATGVSMLQLAIASKRVELLKEIAPEVKRVAVLASPDHPGVGSELRATHEAAEKLSVQVEVFEPSSDETLLQALEAIGRSRAEALLTLPEARTLAHREDIARTARRLRAPSIFGWKVYVEAGGLVSYGPVQARVFERLAYFVDRIIKGSKPGELPVEQPTRLELVLNARSATDIGLLIPPAVLARTDEVIE